MHFQVYVDTNYMPTYGRIIAEVMSRISNTLHSLYSDKVVEMTHEKENLISKLSRA
jgi:hypothetical protein